MRLLDKHLKGHNYLVFLDFEGTQFSHEMIAFGAVLVTLDRKGNIKRYKEGIKYYVKAKNKIGKFVSNLTGITEKQLEEQGLPFNKALQNLRNYCGTAFKKATFITFGNHDMVILNNSVQYNFPIEKDIINQIQKNYFDFSLFLSEFCKDANNNPLSLSNYCKHFGIKEEGLTHDPLSDAINLAHLYEGFKNNPELVLQDYLCVLTKMPHLAKPIKEAVNKLASGQDVSSEEFVELAKKYLE